MLFTVSLNSTNYLPTVTYSSMHILEFCSRGAMKIVMSLFKWTTDTIYIEWVWMGEEEKAIFHLFRLGRRKKNLARIICWIWLILFLFLVTRNIQTAWSWSRKLFESMNRSPENPCSKKIENATAILAIFWSIWPYFAVCWKIVWRKQRKCTF